MLWCTFSSSQHETVNLHLLSQPLTLPLGTKHMETLRENEGLKFCLAWQEKTHSGRNEGEEIQGYEDG